MESQMHKLPDLLTTVMEKQFARYSSTMALSAGTQYDLAHRSADIGSSYRSPPHYVSDILYTSNNNDGNTDPNYFQREQQDDHESTGKQLFDNRYSEWQEVRRPSASSSQKSATTPEQTRRKLLKRSGHCYNSPVLEGSSDGQRMPTSSVSHNDSSISSGATWWDTPYHKNNVVGSNSSPHVSGCEVLLEEGSNQETIL